MNLLRFFLVSLVLATLTGCATARQRATPPNQRLTAHGPSGFSRVIIYNSSSALFSSVGHPDRIQVLIDGRVLGTLEHGEYAQVFLPPGRHDFSLTRHEMVAYETDYPVLIDRPTRWLNIRSDTAGSLLEAHDEAPTDFEKKYRAFHER